tara:strand:- start:17993 stop:19009 length:1017 start_codon:yes stop_codon:yes gene_type:complete
MNCPELIKLADDFLKTTLWTNVNDEYCYANFSPTRKIKLDIEQLNNIKGSLGNINVSKDYPNNDNRFHYNKSPHEFYKIMMKLNELEGDGFFFPSGFYYYPPNGACGWHTNCKNPGKRVYLTYAEEGNKSFLRYYDNEKNEIITKYDKKGWNINEFHIEKNNNFWHCVGSNTNRISLGFVKLKNHYLKDKLKLYEEYYENLSLGKIPEKTNNMFRNFLYGKFYHHMNSPQRQKKGKISTFVLNLINIDNIFYNYRVIYLPISEIYWKDKKNIPLTYHKDIEIDSFPIIVTEYSMNPDRSLYIAVDGNERLSKALDTKQITIKAYIIDINDIYKNSKEN